MFGFIRLNNLILIFSKLFIIILFCYQIIMGCDCIKPADNQQKIPAQKQYKKEKQNHKTYYNQKQDPLFTNQVKQSSKSPVMQIQLKFKTSLHLDNVKTVKEQVKVYAEIEKIDKKINYEKQWWIEMNQLLKTIKTIKQGLKSERSNQLKNSLKAQSSINKINFQQNQIKEKYKFQQLQPPDNFVSIQEKNQKLLQQLQLQMRQKNNHKDIHELLIQIANNFYLSGSFYKSISFYQSALQISQKIHGKQSGLDGQLIYRIGLNYSQIEKYDIALSYYQKSLKILQAKSQSLEVAQIIKSIGIIYDEKQEFQKAKQYYSKFYALINRLGEQHEYISQYFNLMAIQLQYDKKYQQAITKYEKALSIKIQVHGRNHHHIALLRFNLAACMFKITKYSQGINQYHKAFSIMKNIQLWEHSSNTVSINNFKKNVKQILYIKELYNQQLVIKISTIIENFFSNEYEEADFVELKEKLKYKYRINE